MDKKQLSRVSSEGDTQALCTICSSNDRNRSSWLLQQHYAAKDWQVAT